MTNEAWIKRQTESPEARRRYEEERLILWTTEAIWKAMDDQGLTRAELAERLGTSRANITQLLSGTRNMTLRSLAALSHACRLRADVHLKELSESEFTEVDDCTVSVSRRVPESRSAWLVHVSAGADGQAQLFAAPGDDGDTYESDLDYRLPTHLQLVA